MKILLSEKQIQKRVKEVAEEINKQYYNKLTVVCVLKGAVLFCSDLIKHLKANIKLEFVTLSTYKNNQSTGEITGNINLSVSENEDVLIVEDIIDSGITLNYLKESLTKQGANVKICTLLNKIGTRKIAIEPDYYCFPIGDEFVFGYGLDDNQIFRNLPYVAVK